MEQLNTFFSQKSPESLLDVGTGTGNFIPVLHEAMPRVKITGIDPNVESLEEAVATYPEFTFREMSGEALRYQDNTFDVASISMALHHLPNVFKTFTEMQRVVKPGGWIIVNELYSDKLNPAQKVQKRMHHFRSKIDRIIGLSHNETFTRSEIIEQVEKSGLEILLHFDHKKTGKQESKAEILERYERMKALLEEVNDHPEYDTLSKEIHEIKADLQKYGFEMVTCVVVVARVKRE